MSFASRPHSEDTAMLRFLTASLLCTATLLAASSGGVIETAKRKDAAAVRTLLEHQTDPNAASADGTTALHWAAHWDDLETVDLLIRSGANVKQANRYGVTPLTLTCING